MLVAHRRARRYAACHPLHRIIVDQDELAGAVDVKKGTRECRICLNRGGQKITALPQASAAAADERAFKGGLGLRSRPIQRGEFVIGRCSAP